MLGATCPQPLLHPKGVARRGCPCEDPTKHAPNRRTVSCNGGLNQFGSTLRRHEWRPQTLTQISLRESNLRDLRSQPMHCFLKQSSHIPSPIPTRPHTRPQTQTRTETPRNIRTHTHRDKHAITRRLSVCWDIGGKRKKAVVQL